MIALNKILENKESFESRYKLMGKEIKLDKVFALEQKFITLDQQANTLRANCNKLCAEIAGLIDNNLNHSQAILEINRLHKQISKLTNKSQKAMQKINKILRSLPNLALDENTLNISIKTKPINQVFSKEDFIKEISSYAKLETIASSERKYLNSLTKVVFKLENLPKLIKLNSQTSKQKFIFLCNSSAINIMNDFQGLLSINSKYLILKSIKKLKRYSSKELFASLSDGTVISIEFMGEYVSREKSIKFYDKNLDMTQFVNMIKITIF